jgi:triacylglycerol esterase/lipase EstA (alpha/beta hydrolase family)
MLARLQKTLCISLLLTATWALASLWGTSPLRAIVTALLIFFGFTLILACEFVIMYLVHKNDATPRTTVRQMGAAWWMEARQDLRVFFWRQPFRSNAVPDDLAQRDLRGVVFIHGLFCNRGFWTPWMLRLRQAGRPYVAVNLEPPFGAIDDYISIVESAVQRVTAATGMPPVLICHSMGGLAARAWLGSNATTSARVARVVTIGTPHAGTWMARFGHGHNGRQMRLRSEWLSTLAGRETADCNALFTCWYSNCDNIVFPASTAALAGADNRLVPGVAHVALAFHPTVMRESLAML